MVCVVPDLENVDAVTVDTPSGPLLVFSRRPLRDAVLSATTAAARMLQPATQFSHAAKESPSVYDNTYSMVQLFHPRRTVSGVAEPEPTPLGQSRSLEPEPAPII